MRWLYGMTLLSHKGNKMKAARTRTISQDRQERHTSLRPTTTVQEDITTAGQRRVNLIWELTQAMVAIIISGAFIFCEIKRVDSVALRMAFSLVIGFYFSRTNHQAIGGIGKKPDNKYVGR